MVEQKGFEPFGDPQKPKNSGRWLCPEVAGLVQFAPRWGKVSLAPRRFREPPNPSAPKDLSQRAGGLNTGVSKPKVRSCPQRLVRSAMGLRSLAWPATIALSHRGLSWHAYARCHRISCNRPAPSPPLL